MRAADHLEPGEFWGAARADALQNAPRWRERQVRRARNRPADSLIPRAIRHEGLAEIVELVTPRVHPAAKQDLHFLVTWIETKCPARFQPHDTMRRLGVGASVHRLV